MDDFFPIYKKSLKCYWVKTCQKRAGCSTNEICAIDWHRWVPGRKVDPSIQLSTNICINVEPGLINHGLLTKG